MDNMQLVTILRKWMRQKWAQWIPLRREPGPSLIVMVKQVVALYLTIKIRISKIVKSKRGQQGKSRRVLYLLTTNLGEAIVWSSSIIRMIKSASPDSNKECRTRLKVMMLPRSAKLSSPSASPISYHKRLRKCHLQSRLSFSSNRLRLLHLHRLWLRMPFRFLS